MKTLTIILACLLSSSVMAQKKDSAGISFIADKFSGVATVDSSCYLQGWASGNGTLLNTFNNLSIPLTYTWMTEAKKAMEVTEKDSLGNIKVWIDPKRIVWTSDSTFVLKTK